MLAGSPRPSRYTSRSWLIASESWHRTTQISSCPATTSPAPTRRRAGLARPSPCTSGLSRIASDAWHPITPTPSIPATNLARAYDAAGRPDQAIPRYEQTMADCERVLGPDHHLTVAVRQKLDRA